MKAKSVVLTLLTIAPVTYGLAVNQMAQPKNPPTDPEKLFLEAATFFDPDAGHFRVSEAKAISDLLVLGVKTDSSRLHHLVKKYGLGNPDRGRLGLYWNRRDLKRYIGQAAK